MQILTIALLALTANAETFTVDLAIVQEAPASGEFVKSLLVVKLFGADDVSLVESTLPGLTCEITGGVAKATWYKEVADWPTTWPATATCVTATDTVVFTLSAIEYTADQLWMDREAALNETIYMDVPQGGVRIWSRPMPAETATFQYTTGIFPAVLPGPTPWNDVTCEFHQHTNGVWLLRIKTDMDTGVTGSGKCVAINAGSGMNQHVDLVVSEI